MKIKTVLFFLCFFTSIALFAQENETTEQIRYSNITEFGLIATSPIGISFEATTVHGIAIMKKHHFGFGVGIGGTAHRDYRNGMGAHMPLFVNYRCYFKPDRNFSPHVNVALGGLVINDGHGIYSSVTAGFKAGKFSFSSGFSFLAVQRDDRWYNYDPWTGGSWQDAKNWYFPFGITLKWGFAF